MTPRAFLIRSLVPGISISSEAEELGLYGAAAARSWSHFPHMLRVDGLSTAQVTALREKARLLQISAAEAMPYRHGVDWSEGLLLAGDTTSLAALARDISISYASVGRALSSLLETLGGRSFRLHLKSGDLTLGNEAGVALMGILNVTPDSFSDGGRFVEPQVAVEHGLKMAADGARLIDVGGESSRPRSVPVPEAQELSRVVPVIEKLRAALPAGVGISIDTMKAVVARAAVKAGADIINDVSGLSADSGMRAAAADLGVPVIINHMRGTPRTMQEMPSYRHVIPEVLADLDVLVEAAMRAGIEKERIIIDPGIGFGKRLSDNVAILRHLPAFVSAGRPLAVGVSRKSFLASLAPDAGPETDARGDATVAAETLAALGGAHILRTHDPARAERAVRLAEVLTWAHRGTQT